MGGYYYQQVSIFRCSRWKISMVPHMGRPLGWFHWKWLMSIIAGLTIFTSLMSPPSAKTSKIKGKLLVIIYRWILSHFEIKLCGMKIFCIVKIHKRIIHIITYAVWIHDRIIGVWLFVRKCLNQLINVN